MIDYTSRLYRPNPCEIEQIKAAEILKRRKIRILQARRLAKMHSSMTRLLYNEKLKRKLNKEAELFQSQQLINDAKLLHDKQNVLDDVMDNFAGGHRIASSWRDPAIEVEKRQIEARIVEQQRFVEAYSGLMLTRAQSQKETELRRRFREIAKVTERERAAAIAALPVPPPDPLEPHFNSNGTICSLCPREKPKEYHLVVEVESSRGPNAADSVGVKIEKGHCDVNVERAEITSVAEKEGIRVPGGAFASAIAENERVEIERRRAARVAAEAALKTQVRGRIALKRVQAMQEYQELMRQLGSANVQNTHQYELALSKEERLEPPFRQGTGSPRSDLAHLGPGERANLPPLMMSIHQTSFQPRLAPSPEPSPSSTYDQNPPILLLSMTHSDSPISRTEGGFQETSSVSTDHNAPKSRKTHFANHELPQTSGVDNSRPTSSTTSRTLSFYERMKKQLDCEVESLDKEIQKLHESYAISLQSKLLAEGNGEKVVQATALEPTLHQLKDGEGLQVISSGKADGFVCPQADLSILTENVGSEHPISFKAHANETQTLGSISIEGARESAEFSGSTTPISSPPSAPSVKIVEREKNKSVTNKPTIEIKIIPISDSLRRRAAELIRRQTERLRSTRRGAFETSSNTLSNNSADVHSLNESIFPSTLPVNSCHSSDSCLNLFTSTTSSSSTFDVYLAPSDNVVLRPIDEEAHTVVDDQPVADGKTKLSVEVTTESAPTKHEILQNYLKQLMGTHEVKVTTEVNAAETTGLSASPNQPSAICRNQSNNNFIPPDFSASQKAVIANRPDVAEDGDLISKEIDDHGSPVMNSPISMDPDPKPMITNSSSSHFVEFVSHNIPEVPKPSKIFEDDRSNTEEISHSTVSDILSVHRNGLARKISPISVASSYSKWDSVITSCSSGHSGCHFIELSSVSPKIMNTNLSEVIESDGLITQENNRQSKEPTSHVMDEEDSPVAVSATLFSSAPSDSETVINSSSSDRRMNHFTELSSHALSNLQSNSELDVSSISSGSMKRKIAVIKQPKVDESRQPTPLSQHSSQEEHAVPSQLKITVMKSVKESDSEGVQANIQSNSTSGPYPSANFQLWSNESAVFSGGSRLPSNSSHPTAKSPSPDAGYVVGSPTAISFTPSPDQNRIWFQRSKYGLHSLGSNSGGDRDSSKTLVNSTQTDSTPNSSSRPSNQFSNLSSASSVCKASPQLELIPSTAQYSTTLTTLHHLRSGLSSDIPSGSDASNQQCYTSVSTLTFLRRDLTQVESLSPISSDLSSLLSTNNSAPSNNDESFPEILLTETNFHLKTPLRKRSPVAASRSPSLDMLTCRSTQVQSEITHQKVSPSPVSTLKLLRCNSIPPTPVLSTDEQMEPVKPHSSPGYELTEFESITTNLGNPIFYSLTNNCLNTNAVPGKDREGVGIKDCETDCEDEGTMESCVSSYVSMDSSVENVRCCDDDKFVRVCQTARTGTSMIASVKETLFVSCAVEGNCLCTTPSLSASPCDTEVSMTTGERYQSAPACDLNALRPQCTSPDCQIQQLNCSGLCTRSRCILPLSNRGNTCPDQPGTTHAIPLIGASDGAQNGIFTAQSVNVETPHMNMAEQCASITASDVNGGVVKTEAGPKYVECACQGTPGISATISSRIMINSSKGMHERKQCGTNASPIDNYIEFEQAIERRNSISPEEINLMVCTEPNASGMQTEMSETKVFEGEIRSSQYAVLAASTICVSSAVDAQTKTNTLESDGPKVKVEVGTITINSESYDPKESVFGRKISDPEEELVGLLSHDKTDIKSSHRKLVASLEGYADYISKGGVTMGTPDERMPNDRELTALPSSSYKLDPRFDVKSKYQLPPIILPRAPFVSTDDNVAIEESCLRTDETATTINASIPFDTKTDILRDKKLSDPKTGFGASASSRRSDISESVEGSRHCGFKSGASRSDKLFDQGTKRDGSVLPVEESIPLASKSSSPRSRKLRELEAGFSDLTQHAPSVVRKVSADYKPETAKMSRYEVLPDIKIGALVTRFGSLDESHGADITILKEQTGVNEVENAEAGVVEKLESSKNDKIDTIGAERISESVKMLGSKSEDLDSSIGSGNTTEMARETGILSTELGASAGSKLADWTLDTAADGELLESQLPEGNQMADEFEGRAVEVDLKANGALDTSNVTDHSENKPMPPPEFNIVINVTSPDEDGRISIDKRTDETELIGNESPEISSSVEQAKSMKDALKTHNHKVTSHAKGLETAGGTKDVPNISHATVTNIGVNAKAADHEVPRSSGAHQKKTEDREAFHLKHATHSDGTALTESETVLNHEELTAGKFQVRESPAKESSILKTRSSSIAQSTHRRSNSRPITSKKGTSLAGGKTRMTSLALKRKNKQGEEKPESAGLPVFLTSDTVASLARKQRIAQELEEEEPESKEEYEDEEKEEKEDYYEDQKTIEPSDDLSTKSVSGKPPVAKARSVRSAKTSSSESVLIKYALPKPRFVKRERDFMPERIEEVFSESFPFQRILIKRREAKPRKAANFLRKSPLPDERKTEAKPPRKGLSCRRPT